jgi:hypothetical protein
MFHFEDRYFPITEFVELPRYGLFRLVLILFVRHGDVFRAGSPAYTAGPDVLLLLPLRVRTPIMMKVGLDFGEGFQILRD